MEVPKMEKIFEGLTSKVVFDLPLRANIFLTLAQYQPANAPMPFVLERAPAQVLLNATQGDKLVLLAHGQVLAFTPERDAAAYGKGQGWFIETENPNGFEVQTALGTLRVIENYSPVAHGVRVELVGNDGSSVTLTEASAIDGEGLFTWAKDVKALARPNQTKMGYK